VLHDTIRNTQEELVNTYVVTILPGGRITIPVAMRRSLGLRPGDTVLWWKQDGEIHLRKAEQGEIHSSDVDAAEPDTDHRYPRSPE
jgi:AbrB family looped-hinge helix DNA binding protein